jgi:hypothetical protein
VFITKYGKPWETKSHTDNPVSKKMAKVLKALGTHRKGVGFYALMSAVYNDAIVKTWSDTNQWIEGELSGC